MLYSMEAEMSVLGGLLMDNPSWKKIEARIHKHDFYYEPHKIIFSVIQKSALKNEAFDLLTVVECLRSSNRLDLIGGEAYLYKLAASVPSVANIIAYTDIVRERSLRRQILKTLKDHIVLAEHNEIDTADIMLSIHNQISDISKRKCLDYKPIKLDVLMAEAFHKLSQDLEDDYVKTGFYDLDFIIKGLTKGNLIVLAARPSMGKTTLAMNIIEKVSKSYEKPILFFSMEMSSADISARFLSSQSRISQMKMHKNSMGQQQWREVGESVADLSTRNVYVDDSGFLTPTVFRDRVNNFKLVHGEIGLVVIDYLQLMNDPIYKNNRVQEISSISRILKAVAKETETPVLALSQLSRALDSRNNKRPILSDLRDSGSIEQDSDIVMFLYRDEYYTQDKKGQAEVIVSKNRNGPIDSILLKFTSECTRFENFTQADRYGI